MQRDYVTKEEFGEFREEFEDFRDVTFKDESKFVRDGFEGLDRKIDFVEKNLGDKIDNLDSKVTNINLNIHSLAGDVSWLKRSMGKVMKKMGV